MCMLMIGPFVVRIKQKRLFIMTWLIYELSQTLSSVDIGCKMTWTGCSPRGALVVLGGFIVHLSLGTFFTFGKNTFL